MESTVFRFSRAVRADYSQFYVIITDGTGSRGNDRDLSIARYFEPQMLQLITPRQWGEITVDGSIAQSRPSELGREWKDVAEISLTATSEVRLTGWESTSDDLVLPLQPGREYRLRYAISDMDDASPLGEAASEHYRVDLWPQLASPSRVIAQETKRGRYWEIAAVTEMIRDEVNMDGGLSSDTERLQVFARRAYARFPDLRNEVASTGSASQGGLSSTAWGLLREGPSRLSPSDSAAQFDSLMERLVSVLVATALEGDE